jgi:hypothetical protein
MFCIFVLLSSELNNIHQINYSLTTYICRNLHWYQWRTQEFFWWGEGVNQFSWRQRIERMEIWERSSPSQGFRLICNWVKPVFLLGCYECIFHGSENLSMLCQNFGIWGEGLNTSTPHPARYATDWYTPEYDAYFATSDFTIINPFVSIKFNFRKVKNLNIPSCTSF